jgi:hypothetical protein
MAHRAETGERSVCPRISENGRKSLRRNFVIRITIPEPINNMLEGSGVGAGVNVAFKKFQLPGLEESGAY